MRRIVFRTPDKTMLPSACLRPGWRRPAASTTYLGCLLRRPGQPTRRGALARRLILPGTLSLIAVWVALAAPGCSGRGPVAFDRPDSTGEGDQTQEKESPASSATRPSGGAVIAYVNGSPVYKAPLEAMLLREYGLSLAHQLVADELVRQAAAEKKLPLAVSDEEIQAEHELALRELFPNLSDASQRELALEQLLLRKGHSRMLWRRTMRRNVLLGRLAEPRVTVSEAELRAEFGEEYGRKVVVRHIQAADLSEAQDVLRRLRAGEDFARLAAAVSKNPSARDGGLLPPIGARAEGLPVAMRQAARAMKKVGDISEPVQVGATFHILRLEEIIEPTDAKFEDVKDQLAAKLKARKVKRLKDRILRELIREGKIEFVDPILKSQSAKANKGISQ